MTTKFSGENGAGIPTQKKKEDEVEEPVVQEEAWEDLGGTLFSAGYAAPSSRRIPFYQPSSAGIEIQSVDTSNMTLLDFCNYNHTEEHVDGSGHCIWMGALYFIHVLTISSATTGISGAAAAADDDLMSSYVHNKKVVAEMGCGTGTAGIAVLKLIQENQHSTQTIRMIFLDNDKEALELCRNNCNLNTIPESNYIIQYQDTWSEEPPQHSSFEQQSTATTIDTVLATDVLYDLKIIRPFLATASRILDSYDESLSSSSVTKTATRHLILSHVPRWFLPTSGNSDDDLSSKNKCKSQDPARDLEEHIVNQAKEFGLILVKTVRPRDLLQRIMIGKGSTSDDDSNNHNSVRQELTEMEQAGAVLWIFEKE
jgi:hypothetical protein